MEAESLAKFLWEARRSLLAAATLGWWRDLGLCLAPKSIDWLEATAASDRIEYVEESKTDMEAALLG